MPKPPPRQPLRLSDLPDRLRPDEALIAEQPVYAELWLRDLAREGLAWHPDDPPDTVGNMVDGHWTRTFADDAAAHLQALMTAVFLHWPDLDPYAILLSETAGDNTPEGPRC